MAASTTATVGRRLGGKLRLVRRIGSGGMGEVWVAQNEKTQADVAVKMLKRAERSTDQEERFRREARLSATISHRHVVRIFDLVDEDDGTLGLVMEFLRGGTLEASMTENGPLSGPQAIAVALPVLSALHHIHEKGIIHRDVKPSNVFFALEPDGHVIPKILDFGIAKLPSAGAGLTVDGSILGTPHYMSPEQIRGNSELDGRSDMFSFAVVLYEMLTGVRLFERSLPAASLAAVLELEVDPDPRIDPRLWLVLSRALAKRSYERYATCAEFAAALKSAVPVSDDENATLLRDILPRRSVITELPPPPPEEMSASEGAQSIPVKKSARSSRWTTMTTGVLAAFVVLLVAVAARWKSSDAAPSAPGAMASATSSTVASASMGVPPAASVVPPAPPASSTAESPTPPSNERARPHGSSTSPRPRQATAGSAKPASGAKPIATTPGF
ncbi:serine/threonine protein kinase [Labilithrix luteola]|uniref:Serine/threonine protein kinase n=1 Tax=Labilithrix luteola TaxID=1391654 RepID=A0A0K1PSK8_9BACT|nr:serine/threonine-protein kinase [Labilithrix luteola]AKU96525.1 serine/threonine protein kinase [Labilithrix luteola]